MKPLLNQIESDITEYLLTNSLDRVSLDYIDENCYNIKYIVRCFLKKRFPSLSIVDSLSLEVPERLLVSSQHNDSIFCNIIISFYPIGYTEETDIPF